MSYFHVINTIKDALLLEPFCNTVTEGDLYEVDLKKQTIFPLSHLVVNSASFEENVIRFNVSIIAMDIVDISKDVEYTVFRGNDNEQDVLNTQLLLLNRVYERISRGDIYSANFQIDGGNTCEPFRERHENNLAGWTITFDVLTPNEMTICNVPN